MANQKKKPLSEEIAERKDKREKAIERRINLAKERGARVLQVQSYNSNTILNIVQQFDKIFTAYKNRLGIRSERGVPFEKGIERINEASDWIFGFSEFTESMAAEIGFTYYVPEEVAYWKKQMEEEKTEDRN